MSKKLNPLVFFGTEDFSADILSALIKSNFIVEAVITKPDLVKGRGKKVTPPAVKILAENNNIPVFQISNTDDLKAAVAKTSLQTGVLASFGKIIPESVINSFKNGIINVHPSLLPKYRGSTPIESVIINGDSKTGVSIMNLVKEVDAGPVYNQAELILNGDESKEELYKKLARIGGNLLLDTLYKIENENLIPIEQNHSKAILTSMLQKSDGLLKPQLYTAQKLANQIRAYQDFPKPKYTFFGHEIIILKAEVSNLPSILSVQAKDGKYLNIRQIKSPTGKTISAEEFIRGYKK